METGIYHEQQNRQVLAPRSSLLAPRTAFTLVELLVVIAIIGILVALITVAAVGALRTAQRTRIKTEITEIANAFDELKNKTTAYPPNALIDYGTVNANEKLTLAARLQILNDLRRYLKLAFPRHQEPDDLIARLAGLQTNGNPLTNGNLLGGMRAGEALVFWLGGFSSDPKYPISGDGGPSYSATLGNADPIETRHWIYPVDVSRLGKRDSNGYFDTSDNRYIEYPDPRPGHTTERRRINFWQYAPAKSNQPFIYFDTSRHAPNELDPPAAPDVHVHALKKVENAGSANERVTFVNPAKFQVLHCGLDDVWGEDFDRMSYAQYIQDKNAFLSFPNGPFTGDVADTEANFFTESTLEDAQK